jgi:hypothetical protein
MYGNQNKIKELIMNFENEDLNCFYERLYSISYRPYR